MATETVRLRAARSVMVGIALLALMVFSTWVGRGRLLDDTYIHLRYARNFLETGQIAYNLGHRSAGSSSMLYMMMLAEIGRFLPRADWPGMAKIISIMSWAVAVAGLVWLVPRGSRGRGLLLVAAVALMVAVPSATRWLQDGMETSSALLAAVVAVVAVRGWRRAPEQASVGDAVCTGLLVSLPFLLRIEGLFTTTAALGLCVVRPRGRAVPLVVTGVVVCAFWAAFLVHTTGALVPDTALAKRMGHFTPHFLVDMAMAMAGVSPLWLAGALLLAIGAVVAKSRARPWTAAMGIMPIAATVAAGMVEGQFVHGGRYFLPQLGFAWGVWLMELGQDEPAAPPRWAMAVVALFAVLGLGHAVWIWPRLERVFQPAEFTSDPELERPGEVVLAYDIGELGWFTDATVLDAAGLVNGSEIARARGAHRLALCVRAYGMPDAMMLIDWEADGLDPQHSVRPLGALLLQDGEGGSAAYIDSGKVVCSGYSLSGPGHWDLWVRQQPRANRSIN